MIPAGLRFSEGRLRAIPLALAALHLAIGCAAAPPPPPAAPPPPPASAGAPSHSNGVELPPLLQGLDLTPQQELEIWRINTDYANAAELFVGAANDLAHSVAGAATACKGDSPFIEQDAARVVRLGEEMRGPTIEAAQRFHRLLTPAQRKKLSARLVEGDDWAKRERRNASRTRDLGAALDLTGTQVMKMLLKAASLWATFAEKAEPWRVHYRTAITNFARDDFDAKSEPVASAPAVALTVEFVRTGLRMLIPVLEPKQCEALGRVINEKIDEQAAKAAERAAAREKALAASAATR